MYGARNPAAFTCYGREKLSAVRAATLALQMRKRHHDGKISAYRCEHCGGWHVGLDFARLKEHKPRRTGTDG